MAVTHAPAGFTGTVDQVDEARRFALSGGGRFKVLGSADWAPSASGSVNRTVNIAAGMAQACGVVDITTAADTVTFAANGGGTDPLRRRGGHLRLVQRVDVLPGRPGHHGVPPVIVRTGTTVDTPRSTGCRARATTPWSPSSWCGPV
jgi:hypothetical protein